MKQNRAMSKKRPRRTDGRTAAAQASPVPLGLQLFVIVGTNITKAELK
jgi:hypothetical protein